MNCLNIIPKTINNYWIVWILFQKLWYKFTLRAICCHLYIAYGNKQCPSKIKYSDILLDLNSHHKPVKQIKNEINVKSLIPFDIVLQTQQKIENDFLSYQSGKSKQDVLFISLHSLIPVIRDELK